MNSVLSNANINTKNWDEVSEPIWIKCSKEELQEVVHLFRPELQRDLVERIHEQMEMGIDFAFWFESSGHLYCEG